MITELASRNARTFASIRKHRNFRLYLTGQFVSLTGTWMQDTALAWLVFGRTHSSFDVGLLVFFRFTPMTVFTLFAGVFADRFDNRRALIATNSAAMAVAAALAGLTLAGAASLPAIYALAFIGGAVGVFNAPNRLALSAKYESIDARTASASTRSPSADDPETSQNTNVANFRRSTADAPNTPPHNPQKRKPSGFSPPHAGQICTNSEPIPICPRLEAARPGVVPHCDKPGVAPTTPHPPSSLGSIGSARPELNVKFSFVMFPADGSR